MGFRNYLSDNTPPGDCSLIRPLTSSVASTVSSPSHQHQIGISWKRGQFEYMINQILAPKKCNLYVFYFRAPLPIVLFTLYQNNSTEGIMRHFESLVKILLENMTMPKSWKMPVSNIFPRNIIL